MKKTILVLLMPIVFVLTAKSQDYNTAIGLRGGFGSGLTVKHFIKNDAAIEGILNSRWRGFNITGLYEVHKNAFDVPRLNWYYGAGAHIGFYDVDADHPFFEDDNLGSLVVVGIDGIIALEYNIQEIPINLSIDWKPYINLVGYWTFIGDGGAFSARYYF